MLQVAASTTQRILFTSHHRPAFTTALAPRRPAHLILNRTLSTRPFSATPRKMGRPVILCGKTEQIGAGVIATLKPEYDVIHFVMTPKAGASQIPAILRGDPSPASDSQLGSRDYSAPPVAVILGGGYTDEDINFMFKAASEKAGDKNAIPWLRPDLTKPAAPLGPEYGRTLTARIKALLGEMEKEGKMGEGRVVWY